MNGTRSMARWMFGCLCLMGGGAASCAETGLSAAVRLGNGDLIRGDVTRWTGSELTVKPRWGVEPMTLPTDRVRRVIPMRPDTESTAVRWEVHFRNGDRIFVRDPSWEGGKLEAVGLRGEAVAAPLDRVDRLRHYPEGRLLREGPDLSANWTVLASRNFVDDHTLVHAGQALLLGRSPPLQVMLPALPEGFLIEVDVDLSTESFDYRLYFLESATNAQERVTLQVESRRAHARWFLQADDNRRRMDKWELDPLSIPGRHRVRLFGNRASSELRFQIPGVADTTWSHPRLAGATLDGPSRFRFQLPGSNAMMRVAGFRLIRWDGGTTFDASADSPGGEELVFYNGTRLSGELEALSGEAMAFRGGASGEEASYSSRKVFEWRRNTERTPAARDGEPEGGEQVFFGGSGERLTGRVIDLNQAGLVFRPAGWEDVVVLPLSSLTLVNRVGGADAVPEVSL